MAEGIWLPPVWVRPEPDEPLHGVLLRLCEINGLPMMNHLEVAGRIDSKRVRGGEQTELVALMLRCDAASLEPNMWKRDSPNYRSWNGVSVSIVRDADFVHRRVCPDCLIENAYHRFHWDVSVISSCLRHDRLLVDRCSCGERLSWRDGAFAKCRICDDGSVHDMPAERPDPDAAAFDAYLLGRLGVGPVMPLPALDRLPIRQACDVVGRIGALDVLGYRPRWTEVRDVDMPAAIVRGRGFVILRGAKLAETLERVFGEFEADHRASLPASHHRPRLDDAYGWFVPWFRHRGAELLSPEIAAAIVRHASTKFMVTADTFPGVERAGDTLNLMQARAVCGISSRTLRQMLILEGLAPVQLKKGSPVRIERAVVDRIVADLAGGLTQVDLVEVLGLTISAVEQLCKADGIPCWLNGGGRDFHRYRFRRRDVDAWLAGLLKGAERVEAVPDGAMPLRDYAAAKGIPTIETIARLRRGELALATTADAVRTFANVFVTGMNADAADVVSASVIVKEVGIVMSEALGLVEAGLVERREGAPCFRRDDRVFVSRRSLDRLVRSVREAAQPWDAGTDHRKRDKIRLTKAVRRFEGGVSWSSVLTAVVDGRLRSYIDPATSPTLTASLFLDAAGDLEFLVSEADGAEAGSRRVSLAEAAAYLGTNVAAVSDFRKADLLGSQKSQLGVCLDDLRQFEERYILTGEIVERGSATWFEITDKLKAAGIHPVREWPSRESRPGRRIYDRETVERFMGHRRVDRMPEPLSSTLPTKCVSSLAR